MSQIIPITIDQYHNLKTFENIHEKYSIDSRGDIFTYIEKVQDIHRKSDDKKFFHFHESFKTYSVYDEF